MTVLKLLNFTNILDLMRRDNIDLQEPLKRLVSLIR